jgi:signal transduction histidine kinase
MQALERGDRGPRPPRGLGEHRQKKIEERGIRARRRAGPAKLGEPVQPVGAERAAAVRLKQVFLNLLSNAIKFTPRGGEVRLTAEQSDTGVTIAVRDTGIGMRPEDVAVALEPFGQIDASFARRHEGTGLGLSLSKNLVELHGGRLEIETAPGAGTTVAVRFLKSRIAAAA